MVKSLDKKTFQVDINAKLVEVDVEATRELGINWGLLNLHASGLSGIGSIEVNNPIAAVGRNGQVRHRALVGRAERRSRDAREDEQGEHHLQSADHDDG